LRRIKLSELKFICDYKNIDKYRLSFNELANSIFGIDFEKWYQTGLWNDSYVCYSYAEGDRIVSNVSVNTIELILNGQKKSAVQIGTVMTHPDYRGRGLAASLMKTVLKEYENKCELIYLFPNVNALGFYHRFGFSALQESTFTKEIHVAAENKIMMRKLNISNEGDLKIVTKLAAERLPNSSIFGADKAGHILTWYAVNVFADNIYYLEDKGTIAIFDVEGETLNLYDVISRDEVELDEVLNRIAAFGVKRVKYYFTPQPKDIGKKEKIEDPDDLMFIKGNTDGLPEYFRHPITAHA
jgi:predicted N-acetyltransferase YhbS